MIPAGTSDLATELIRRADRMKAYRGSFEGLWTQIAQYVLPRADDFQSRRSPGQRRDQAVFDSTAPLALPAFAAAMESMLTPRAQRWHHLAPVDKRLRENETVMRWLEAKRDLMFRVRYAPKANFASQTSEVYTSLGAFGTGALFIHDALAKGIRYQSIPLAQLYVAEDAYGCVDTVIRRYPLTVRQAAQKWGENALTEAMAKALLKNPEQEFDFLHVVQPNEEIKRGDRSHRGMKMAAYDVAIEGRKLMGVGGYRTMPYAVSRYVTAVGEVYGRSPAMDALADIMTVNAMSKTGLRYGQLVTDPPWATADVDSLQPFSMRSGAINSGYVDDQGRILAHSLAPQGDPRFSLEMQDQRRQAINRSFLVTLFQILVDTPEMTATEAMLRAQEKGALLAPSMGRQQAELLGPMIERELDILDQGGAFADMPDELRRAGGIVEAEYESPLSRLQKAEEGVGVVRTLEAIRPLAEIDQSVVRRINPDETLKILAEVNGAPLRMLFTDEQMAERNAADAQAAELQQTAQVAPALAGAAKDLAAAQRDATSAPF